MENIIADISIAETDLPLVSDCDMLTATENFRHMDRTADFNDMIYVTDGMMYVTECDIDYEIGAGELLFLKIRDFKRHPLGVCSFYAERGTDQRENLSSEENERTFGKHYRGKAFKAVRDLSQLG